MNGSDRIKKVLSETMIFSGVADPQLTQIAECSEYLSCPEDTVLYDHGDVSDEIYVLISGSVRFVFGERAGTLSSGTVMESRMIFGWAALLPDRPRRLGSARCIRASEFVVLPGEPVLAVLRDHPETGFHVMRHLCGMIARSFMAQRD